MQEQAQATIIARVAYMLLNLFILSTAFRCNSDAQGGWHSSNLAYTAGFAATVLASIALYIVLTFRDPGYIPVAHGVRQLVSTTSRQSTTPFGSGWSACRQQEGIPVAIAKSSQKSVTKGVISAAVNCVGAGPERTTESSH